MIVYITRRIPVAARAISATIVTAATALTMAANKLERLTERLHAAALRRKRDRFWNVYVKQLNQLHEDEAQQRRALQMMQDEMKRRRAKVQEKATAYNKLTLDTYKELHNLNQA